MRDVVMMGLCTRCKAERIEGKAFCHKCGHKFLDITPPDPASQNAEIQDGGHEQDQTIKPNTSGTIYIQNESNEIAFSFEDAPKAIGRQDMREFFKSQNTILERISRKQCTIFKEDNDYYIEDGMTSVQDKPSGNGTTVNGQEIAGTGKIKLNNGDQIVLGTVANAVFRID